MQDNYFFQKTKKKQTTLSLGQISICSAPLNISQFNNYSIRLRSPSWKPTGNACVINISHPVDLHHDPQIPELKPRLDKYAFRSNYTQGARLDEHAQ